MLPVHCAWRKHGEPEIELAGEYQDIESLHNAERELIIKLGTLSPNGYNVSHGGDTAPSKSPDVAAKISAKAIGRRHTDEVRAKMAVRLKERWNDPAYREKVAAGVAASMTDERRAHMSATRKGKKGAKWSEEAKARAKGRTFSPEARRKMSEAAKLRKREPRSADTCRKIADNTRRAWQDKALTERRVKAIRAAKATPEVSQRQSDAAKSSWTDPDIRARRLAAMRAKRAVKSSIA